MFNNTNSILATSIYMLYNHNFAVKFRMSTNGCLSDSDIKIFWLILYNYNKLFYVNHGIFYSKTTTAVIGCGDTMCVCDMNIWPWWPNQGILFWKITVIHALDRWIRTYYLIWMNQFIFRLEFGQMSLSNTTVWNIWEW